MHSIRDSAFISAEAGRRQLKKCQIYYCPSSDMSQVSQPQFLRCCKHIYLGVTAHFGEGKLSGATYRLDVPLLPSDYFSLTYSYLNDVPFMYRKLWKEGGAYSKGWSFIQGGGVIWEWTPAYRVHAARWGLWPEILYREPLKSSRSRLARREAPVPQDGGTLINLGGMFTFSHLQSLSHGWQLAL